MKKKRRKGRRGRKSYSFLSRRELIALLRKAQRDDSLMYAMIYIAYHHGLRVSEAVSLKWADVNIQEKTLTCDRLKGSTKSIQPLTDKEIEVFQSLTKTGARIFPLSRSTAHRRFSRLAKACRIPTSKCHFHTLKHSYAVHLLEQGADIRLIQDLLGHRNIQNTIIYAQLLSRTRNVKQLEFANMLP